MAFKGTSHPTHKGPASPWQSLSHTAPGSFRSKLWLSPQLCPQLPLCLWVSSGSQAVQHLCLPCMDASLHSCSHHFLLFQLITDSVLGLWVQFGVYLLALYRAFLWPLATPRGQHEGKGVYYTWPWVLFNLIELSIKTNHH